MSKTVDARGIKAAWVAVVIAVGASAGCATGIQKRSAPEHEAEIRRLWEDSSIALCSGNWDRYRRLWSRGADVEILHPAGGEWIVGADSIMAEYHRLIESGFRCSYRTVRFRVDVSNDASVAWASLEGILYSRDQDSEPQRSWYTLVFERTAGEWQLVHAHASVPVRD